jgi:hypothetical protein
VSFPFRFLSLSVHALGFELLENIIDWHSGSPSDVAAAVYRIVDGICGQRCLVN